MSITRFAIGATAALALLLAWIGQDGLNEAPKATQAPMVSLQPVPPTVTTTTSTTSTATLLPVAVYTWLSPCCGTGYCTGWLLI